MLGSPLGGPGPGGSGSYPGHGLWCAVMGRGGHRAPRAAGSARRPRGEAAPDRKTTSQSLQSECSNPPPAARRPQQDRGWGGRVGRRAGEAGCQSGRVTVSAEREDVKIKCLMC